MSLSELPFDDLAEASKTIRSFVVELELFSMPCIGRLKDSAAGFLRGLLLMVPC